MPYPTFNSDRMVESGRIKRRRHGSIDYKKRISTQSAFDQMPKKVYIAEKPVQLEKFARLLRDQIQSKSPLRLEYRKRITTQSAFDQMSEEIYIPEKPVKLEKFAGLLRDQIQPKSPLRLDYKMPVMTQSAFDQVPEEVYIPEKPVKLEKFARLLRDQINDAKGEAGRRKHYVEEQKPLVRYVCSAWGSTIVEFVNGTAIVVQQKTKQTVDRKQRPLPSAMPKYRPICSSSKRISVELYDCKYVAGYIPL